VLRRESGKSPWEPYHVEFGFNPEESTVTVFGINGFLPIHTAGNRGELALASLAEVIKMHHGVSHLDVGSFGGGTPLIALGIEDAEIMARDGITKKQAKDYLWEHVAKIFRNPSAAWAQVRRRADARSINMTPMMVHLSTKRKTSW
jgi:hypothetical protein